jgi:hypothetical protein
MSRTFAVFLLAIQSAFAGIEVLQPDDLRNSLGTSETGQGSLVYTVSTFGHILYHEQTNVEVLSPGANNIQGCEAFTHPNNISTKKFVWLVERGVCTFSKKAFLAQQSGAYAVLAYHDNPNADIKNIIPCGDKTCWVIRQASQNPHYSH